MKDQNIEMDNIKAVLKRRIVGAGNRRDHCSTVYMDISEREQSTGIWDQDELYGMPPQKIMQGCLLVLYPALLG